MSPRVDMSHVAMGAGAEFDLIRQMRERWGDLATYIGDDASALEVPRGERLLLSTDTSLEAVHFRREWLSPREIGFRSVTAALSDLAAMAATPLGVLVALQLTQDDRARIAELADGIGDAVRAANTRVVGGNVSRGDVLALTTTVAGSAYAPLARSGARPGDLLYVTGALGGPSAALAVLASGATLSAQLRDRFARPAVRVAEARWLATRGAVAAIDISDGLAGDATHLSAASDVALEITVERIPVFPGAREADAWAGGEEYELLLAARAALPEDEFAQRFGIALTPIGRAVEGPPGVRFTKNGKRVAAPTGYDHFSR